VPAQKDNPFSFYNYDGNEAYTKPQTTGKATVKKEEDEGEENPFSFFKQETIPPRTNPPPKPPVVKGAHKNRAIFGDEFSSDEDDGPLFPVDEVKSDPIFPKDSKKKIETKSEARFPQIDEPRFPKPEPKKEKETPLFPTAHTPTAPDEKSRETEAFQAMKKRADAAESQVKRYEQKLIEANLKISDLKEKEIKEAAEMSNALRLIEKNLETMKIRAEKAESQVSLLQQKLKSGDSPYFDPTFREKTQFALGLMQKIATDGQQGMNLLLQGMKDFNLLMETTKNMHKVTEDV